MLTVGSLTKIRDGMKADVATAQSLLETLDEKIQRVKADTTRNLAYQRDKIDELRKAALPAIAAIVRDFDQRLSVVVAQKRLWGNRVLVLSTQRFSDDAATDATIRLGRIAELSHVGPLLLSAIFDNAKDENNLPLIWQCTLAANSPPNREPNGSNVPLDLGDVKLPEADLALETIQQCEALAWTAQNTYSLASGAVLTGVSKLVAARAAAAVQAARNTTHNRAGRSSPAAA